LVSDDAVWVVSVWSVQPGLPDVVGVTRPAQAVNGMGKAASNRMSAARNARQVLLRLEIMTVPDGPG